MHFKYDKSDQEWEKAITNPESKLHSETWMDDGTLDKWRHERMLKKIKFYIDKNSTWLTVGDGRYGTDAHFIIKNGGNAHATDISDTLLKIGNERGYINAYSSQNAENLKFEDNSFDYVLIKEAFHHFPRPWIALHEAFRVARKAVILIEPSDNPSIFWTFKGVFKTILGKSGNYGFEKVGNFIYRINKKELEKFLLGMNYCDIAFNKVIDKYTSGVEFERKQNLSNKGKFLYLNLKLRIFYGQILNFLRIDDGGLLIAALFKEKPNENLKKILKMNNWQFKKLPKNPFN